MRTTLDIEDDVLAAAKELARRHGTSAGEMVSQLLRAALTGGAAARTTEASPSPGVAGFRPFAANARQLVTNEQIDEIRDQTGM